MSKVLNLRRLAEVRHNLEVLVAMASAIELPRIPKEIEDALEEIGLLRNRLFDAPVRPAPVQVPPAPAPRAPRPAPKVVLKEPHPAAPVIRRVIGHSSTFNPERYIPYRLLWAKVIVRAAYDYALWKDAKEIRLRKIAQDAERWLFDDSSLELGFESICFKFDFPVEKIRRRARLLTKDDVKKLEFRERHGRELIGEDVYSVRQAPENYGDHG